MSGNPNLDCEDINQFLQDFEERRDPGRSPGQDFRPGTNTQLGQQFEKRPDPESFFDQAFYPPSNTDHSESSAFYTDGAATSITQPTSTGSFPEAWSPSQLSQDEGTCYPDAPSVERSPDDKLIYPVLGPKADVNYPQALTPITETPGATTITTRQCQSQYSPLGTAPGKPLGLPQQRRPLLPYPSMLAEHGYSSCQGGSPSSSQPSRGTRLVKDPDKTTAMRGNVCIPCKIGKTVCDGPDAICKSCKDPDVCIRGNLGAVLKLGEGKERWCNHWSNGWLNVFRLDVFNPDTNGLETMYVAFSDADPQPLRVQICPCRRSGQSDPLVVIAPNCLPNEDQLFKWAEAWLHRKTEDDCRGAVDSFLVHLAEFGNIVKASTRQLIKNVVKMSAMQHIFGAERLYRHRTGHVEVPESVQAQVRQLAQGVMYQAESEVLKAIDGFISSGTPDRNDIPAVWAVFWSLIFLYRQTLISCRTRVVVNGGISNSNCSEITQLGEDFTTLTSQLLKYLYVIYSKLFRTKNTQCYIASPDRWTCYSGDQGCEAFNSVSSFCDQMASRSGEQDHDNILLKHIIRMEEKVRTRRDKRGCTRPKSS